MAQYVKLSIIFSIILLSISSSSILVLLSGASALSCAFWRVFLANLILTSTRIIRYGLRGFKLDGETVLYSTFAGILLALHFLLWMESLFLIPVAISVTVVVTYPLFSVPVDHFLFREDVGAVQVTALLLGFLGVLLFLHPGARAEYDLYGVLLALGGALSATGYFSLGRFVRRRTGILDYTLLAYTSSSMILLMCALIFGVELFRNPPQTYLYFLSLAVVPMLGGHTLINYILRYVKTSVATSAALGEPIGASLLAYIFFQQQVEPSRALIMILVLSSIGVSVWSEVKEGGVLTD